MDLFEIGEIVKTRGLHGCLKVLSYMEAKDFSPDLDFVYIEKYPEQRRRFSLRKIDVSGSAFFLELQDVNNPEAAQALIGGKVLIPKDLMAELPEGEYYWRDIIGLEVYTEAGEHLGKIESIFPTGSNDVYVCRSDKKETLLPAIADVIKKIDLDKRIMTVQLQKGL